ncbi:transcriptional regulator [Thalassotalea insulae]|uniref:Transcriptional regulator n=1 Tax=Thalassotalea insulae TaxID=2056778 RepID=A0ABQ6GQX1_9GAMM|nr:ArsR family transcriptional regulator [Thalassotalea insulae]GLX78296.1 transcriptional regulator [Thalassotalea insulae]
MKNDIYSRIERLANLLRHETRAAGLSMGLQPIHQETLHYLASCNRYSDTMLAVTEYLGLTKGTVSQTLKVLENKALISREKDKNDKRITHLTVTKQGRTFLAQTAPPDKFSQALVHLSANERQQAKSLLEKMLSSYQQVTGRNAFGVCSQCQYNQQTETGLLCGLTKEALTKADSQLICREYLE